MQPISIDLLLHCSWVLPIVPNNQILQDYSVAIDGGHILEILPTENAKQKYHSEQTEELNRHILMPGLINTQCHSSLRLLRGIDQDLQHKHWLESDPSMPETVFSDSKFIHDSVNIAIAEMIRTGTTCFADMHSAGELFIDIVRKTGIRSQASFTLQERSSIFGNNADDYLHRGLKLRDNQSHHPRIKIACSLSQICDIEDATLERLAAYANELDLPIQIQCNETLEAIETCFKKTGRRPLQHLNEKGLLLPETQLVGINYLNSEDSSILEETNNHVVICPELHSTVSSETRPLDSLVQAGVNLSLSTVNAVDNKDFNLMAVIKAAAAAIKERCGKDSEQAAHQALRMATINGAKALGWENQIGSIEEGKYADLIAVEIDSIHHQPLYNPASQLVYSSTISTVTHSWVAGQPLLKAANLYTLDEQKLIQSARDWGKKLVN